jgi:hypothetical protein
MKRKAGNTKKNFKLLRQKLKQTQMKQRQEKRVRRLQRTKNQEQQ